MNKPQYLSRGIDYLGDLGAKLRDLQGFRTLANELIQNADDVPNVTSMTFNVCDDALIVENDGVFSDCGQIEQHECPWKDESSKGHRCDFHRFRFVASGDKRGEEGTTGAFGIGFIAAYQITDQPELISSGQHWILHDEEQSENQRIHVCPGCDKCSSDHLPRTRFIFPWADNPQSFLRGALRAQAITQPDIDELFKELNRSLLPSMLFLKRLRTIELQINGESKQVFQRLDEGDSLILSDGQPSNDRVWHIIRGSFTEEAQKLRNLHLGKIEPKRSSLITVAIPHENDCKGLFCAFLPTDQETGFPFHINADFFPSNDRKRVNLSAGYEVDWNRAAIRAAAKILANNLNRLPNLLGHRSLWALLESVKKVADKAGEQGTDSTLAAFWEELFPLLKNTPIVITASGEWVMPSRCHILQQKEEAPAIPLLEKLGMKIVSEELRPYQTLLRSDVSIPLLGIPALYNTLREAGFDRSLAVSDWQIKLSDLKDLKILWNEIALLRNREKRTPNVRADNDELLRQLSIALVRGNELLPCRDAYQADPSTVGLFSAINIETPFLSENPDFEPLKDLCPIFNGAIAVDTLDSLGEEKLMQAWEKGDLNLRQLFLWFENHRQELLSNAKIKQKLGSLAIYPSSGRLYKLRYLALPGDFNDPLGLAEIVDLEALGGRREFLQDLGMPPLNFKTYAQRLPYVLARSDITVEKRREAVFLLAERVGEIKDNQMICDALASTPLVECTDGSFQMATDCYFPGNTVGSCLGESVLTAVMHKSHVAACQSLYEWLGVVSQPRVSDLIKRIEGIAGNPYDINQVQVIDNILAYLGKRYRDEDMPAELEILQNISWLPAKGKTDRWHGPNELFAVFQDYLFESQALFLDVPYNIQNASSSLLKFLGIRITPEANRVVKHLLNCSQNGVPVHQEVYRFLNDNAEDPALILLRGKKCFYLKDQELYLSPDQVFWGEHPFGRYRYRLNESLRIYGSLFKRLGVRDGPDHTDALAVLKELANIFDATKQPLNEQDQAVVLSCWRLLETAIDAGLFTEQDAQILNGLKCVPVANGMLNPPEWTFFENRAGLAEKFEGFLVNNVIPIPMGAGRAMATAGVRPLGTAVEVQLLECEDPLQDADLANRIGERRNAFARILDSQIPSDIYEALNRLSSIQFESAQSLIIRYKLHAFNRALESIPEATPALYLASDGRLIFTKRNGQMALPAIARELAIAMLPNHDPGRIAAGVKEVLAAESAAQANQLLDELGYPKLDTIITTFPQGADTIASLGSDGTTNGTFIPGNAGENIGPESTPPMSPGQAVETILGPDAPKPGLPPSETVNAPAAGEASSAGQKQRGSAIKKKRPVLRSYLPSPDSEIETTGDPEEDYQRSPVDEAGVAHVLNYEKGRSRIPKEMPHKNPGYDIESRDTEGNIVRYIEVKSMSGLWTSGYAVLSKPQFDAASRLGENFWLYVVERAQDDSFEIYRIQNPAQRANHFMFDDGWRTTAEIFVSEEFALEEEKK